MAALLSVLCLDACGTQAASDDVGRGPGPTPDAGVADVFVESGTVDGASDALDATPDAAVTFCDSTRAPASFESVAATVATVVLDLPPGPNRTRLSADLESVLERLWGVSVDVQLGSTPPAQAPLVVWLTSAAPIDAPEGGYALARLDDGRPRLIVSAATEALITRGAYALLETLGARFFHPRQEHVPEYGGVWLPKTLSEKREPAFEVIGTHLHTLHPIEWLAPFLEPGDANLALAKQFIDWLVKTGQNHVQWYLLRDLSFAAWQPHAQAIVDYAHARGVTVGVVVQLWKGSSLQRAVELVSDKDDWQTQMSTRLDSLMALPWDNVEIALGEFFASDPATLLTWLNFATAHMADKYPAVTLSAVNHVGDTPDLWVDHQGKKTFYYHLPGYADPRLMNTVHTVMWFDLYRDWGAYHHDDFALHRQFIFEQAGQRRLTYRPESAYWCTADIDVPAFLPDYIRARWLDVNGLHADLAAKGLPRLDGHVVFSSGHEWGYWLTDYLSAKMAWEPSAPLSHFVALATDHFAGCAPEARSIFDDYLALQSKYLFDARLMPYVSGEDFYDDSGALIGVETHPPRVPFEVLYFGSESVRSDFEAQVLAVIDAALGDMRKVEERTSALCAKTDQPLSSWCSELFDGIRIVNLRLSHSSALYKAVLAAARKQQSATDHLTEAESLRSDAALVVANRAQHYRFGLQELAGAYPNLTAYPFGYLRQAHTLCLWKRQHEQAAHLVEKGTPKLFATLPWCLD